MDNRSEANCSDNTSMTTHNDDLQSEAGENPSSQFAFEEHANHYAQKKYVLQSFKPNLSRSSYFIIGAVIIILIISIIVAALNIKKTDNTNEVSVKPSHLLRSLVISSGKSLWIYDVDTKKHQILQTMKTKVTAFDTYIEKTVFWSENDTSSIDSLWGKFSTVTHTDKWRPQTIAVDYVTEKLYFIDKSSETLNIIDIKSKHYGVVISDLHLPHDLVLDPAEGLMFIVQLFQSIVRANMDGTSLTTIIKDPRISAITIDRKATKIYWSSDMSSIETSDYDGNGRLTVMPISMLIIGLAVFENQLFWTRVPNDVSCPCRNALWSCTMYRRMCMNITSHQLNFDDPATIRATFDQHRHLIKNPCALNNGGCEHLCLMTSRGSHDCACNTGWILNPDGKTCGNVTKLMLYVQGSYIRARVLGESYKDAFADAIVPTRFQVESLKNKPVIHFDYDMASGEFYFSDDYSIYKINVLKDDKQTMIFNVSQNFKIKELAFDWVKNYIYYVTESQDPSHNHTITAFSVQPKNKFRKTILTSKYKKEHYINCPFFLLIHPSHEYLFYSDYNGISDNLQRVGTNGKGLILIKPLYNLMYNLLAIDLEKSRLYWTTNADPALIESGNLDGTEEKAIQTRFMTNPGYVGPIADWVYVGNSTEIWRATAETGENASRVVRQRREINGSPAFIHGLRIYSLASRDDS